jgi:predicted lipoprotein
MLGNLSKQVAIPCYEALEKQAKSLAAASASLCQSPTATQLAKAQTAWKEARLAWKRCQIFRFGPAESRDTHSAIDYWPSKTDKIEEEIKKTPSFTPDAVGLLGASRKGFPAMEYLLFPEGKTDKHHETLAPTNNTPNPRCSMLEATASNIHNETKLVLEEWKKAKTPDEISLLFVSPINKDKLTLTRQVAIDEIVNELVFLVERMSDTKLAIPLGSKTGGELQPKSFEAYRSKTSLEALIANLEGVQALYLGANPTQTSDSPTSLSELVLYTNKLVDSHVKRDLANAMAALKQLKGPLVDRLIEDKALISNAQQTLKQLEVTLTVEVVNTLGVILTFSDNDGD